MSDRIHNWLEPLGRLGGSTHSPREAPPCMMCSAPVHVFDVFPDGPNLLRCEACFTETLHPLPSPQAIADYYADYPTTVAHPTELPTLVELNQRCLLRGLTVLGRSGEGLEGQQYLEIGFGNGTALIAAGRLGATVNGVEIDSSSIARTRQLAEEHHIPVNITEGFVGDLNPERQTFDFIKASHVIEHTLDPKAFLNDIAALQREGGTLMIECPNNKALFWLIKNLLRKPLNREMFYNSLKVTEHLWGFTHASLRALVAEAGYDVIELRDYAAGAGDYQPDSALWYPSWKLAIAAAWKQRTWVPFMYAATKSLDWLASAALSGGTGLALVAVRKAPKEALINVHHRD